MDKQNFISACNSQLITVFEKAKNHQKDDRQKHRTEGFIYAGVMLGLITNEEANDILDKSHFEVFGESIASRKARKASIKEAVARGDDDYINIPAYDRARK
jgi:hypothetical protein